MIDKVDKFGRIYFRFRVDPATVGQCTGLKDKNGKLIFEGDIVKTNSGIFEIRCRRTYNALYVRNCRNWDWDGIDEFLRSEYTCYNNKEIIGNIHDNPMFVAELVESGE